MNFIRNGKLFCHCSLIRSAKSTLIEAPWYLMLGQRLHDAAKIQTNNSNMEGASRNLLHHMKPWEIKVAVCLERLPVITPLKSELEQRFEHLQETLEVEHSVLSDLEVKKNENKKKARKKTKMTEKEEHVVLEAERALAKIKEHEDHVDDMKKKFALAERITSDDTNENKYSANRLLDENLFLLVTTAEGTDSWSFPEGPLVKKETLRQAAERILGEAYGDYKEVTFLSNAPAGVRTIKYTPTCNTSFQGCKVFFYKALVSAEVCKVMSSGKGQWLSLEEMKQIMPTDYFKKVNRFL